jgi:hypothetical protein
MVVTVVAVRMMQVAIHQVVRVIAVWHGFVAALGSMPVAIIVTAAAVVRRALRRIVPAYLETVLVHMTIVHVVQMPIVEVVRVAVVEYGGMTAVRAVLMRVTFVCVMHDAMLLAE